jgi:methionine-gamma-lyase
MSRKSWHTSKLGTRPLAPETLMMGYGYDPHLSERSLKPPLFLTSTFVFRSAEDGKAFFELAYGLRQKRRAASVNGAEYVIDGGTVPIA